MGRRSRKRSAGTKGTAARTRADAPAKDAPAATPAAKASAPRGGGAAPAIFSRARERSEARNAQARAKLDPLPPGERPGAVTVAAFVAVALAIANVALWAAGVKVRGQSTSAVGVGAFAVLMLAAALGLWRARYWAVLGFEALLGLTIVIAALSLVVASNLAAVLLCVGIIALAGPLFWKLIRAMTRIQMPDRGPARPDG